MDIRRLVEYRDRLVSKKEKTEADKKMLGEINYSIDMLNAEMKKCSSKVFNALLLREDIAYNTYTTDLPLKIDDRETIAFDKYLYVDGKNTSVYVLQAILDCMGKPFDHTDKQLKLVKNAMRMYNEQIDRLMSDKSAQLWGERLFIKDLTEKRKFVYSERELILGTLFDIGGPYCFGNLTDTQKYNLLTTTSPKVILTSVDLIAKYTTLQELEGTPLRKVLTRFQVK